MPPTRTTVDSGSGHPEAAEKPVTLNGHHQEELLSSLDYFPRINSQMCDSWVKVLKYFLCLLIQVDKLFSETCVVISAIYDNTSFLHCHQD